MTETLEPPEFAKPRMQETIDRIRDTWGTPAYWNVAAQIIIHELSWQSGWQLEQMRPHDIEDYYEIGRWDILARACLADIINLDDETFDTHTSGDVVELLCRKQNDYGPRNIMRFGLPGLAVRLWDKIARLNNLQLKEASPLNESLKDTKTDIVGYTVIAIMLELGWFELPLRTEW